MPEPLPSKYRDRLSPDWWRRDGVKTSGRHLPAIFFKGLQMFQGQFEKRRLPRRVLGVGRTAVVLLAAIGTTACGARYVRSATLPSQPLPQTSVSRNVLVVSVDGLRPDAIATYGA